METRYKHLMSPIIIGKYVFKNRIIATNAMPHFLNGPEQFPSDGVISYFADIAKNGAAAVDFPDNYDDGSRRKIPVPDICRFPGFDRDDPSVDNYISQLTEMIRYNNAIPSAAIRPPEPEGYNVTGGDLTWDENPYPRHFEQITEELLLSTLDEVAEQAKQLWSVGFRMITMHMAYECTLAARFLTARMNTREDKYGGSFENRARYPLALCEAVKKACPDMLVQIIVSGEASGGITLDETVQLAKMCEGKVDLLQFRCETCMASHPTGFNSQKGVHQTIKYAEAVKKSGAKVAVVVVGGYQNPDECERYLKEGKVDMFGMGRSFICDSEYGKKLAEGRGEDITPCIRCNKCHVQNLVGPWISICSVNPLQGLKKRIEEQIEPPVRSKKVAVIGGGPAGMLAAITAAKRGHNVTLYEKTGELGGQLKHSDYMSFKWPLRDYKDWLIGQTYKAGVKVKLGAEATPEQIKAQGFDAVLAALGVKRSILPVSGADNKEILHPLAVFGNEDKIGKRVIIVGGAETGTETGIHLAECGRDVTVVSRQSTVAPDCDRIHYREYLVQRYESLEDKLKFILEAKTVNITPDSVTYADSKGAEHTLSADTIIVSGGVNALAEEAVTFYGSAPEFELIGDCESVGNLQTALRSAFAAASRL